MQCLCPIHMFWEIKKFVWLALFWLLAILWPEISQNSLSTVTEQMAKFTILQPKDQLPSTLYSRTLRRWHTVERKGFQESSNLPMAHTQNCLVHMVIVLCVAWSSHCIICFGEVVFILGPYLEVLKSYSQESCLAVPGPYGMSGIESGLIICKASTYTST